MLAAVFLSCMETSPPAGEPFPAFYEDAGPFLTAIRQAKTPPLPGKINGITVPHHLLAADLMAETWSRVSNQDYNRIIILNSDHYSRSRTPFAVSRRSFQTVLGPLKIDADGVRRVLQNDLVAASNLFSHEHGVQAVLPFAAYYFPKAEIIALAINPSAKKSDLDSLAKTLAPLLTPQTLVVQSTDFSHYLPAAEARVKDQETLRVLSGGDPEAVLRLSEPDHLDSKGAQYLQLRLQKEVFNAGPTVFANCNSQGYTSEPLARTTSYIVQLYSPNNLQPEGTERYCFAGDTFFGRGMAEKLSREEFQEKLIAKVLEVTGGARLIVNLEGVMLSHNPGKTGPYDLWMETALAMPLLKRLNVQAVILANNHCRDFGEAAYQEMVRLLEKKGITVLKNGEVKELQQLYLATFSDVDNSSNLKAARLRQHDFNRLDPVKRDKPLFAFLHWGQEYANEPGPREEEIIGVLQGKRVELIMGCHTHRASTLICRQSACLAFSLGNFIFDQRRPDVSGALLEAIFFPQGTYFFRWHDLDNFFEMRP